MAAHCVDSAGRGREVGERGVLVLSGGCVDSHEAFLCFPLVYIYIPRKNILTAHTNRHSRRCRCVVCRFNPPFHYSVSGVCILRSRIGGETLTHTQLTDCVSLFVVHNNETFHHISTGNTNSFIYCYYYSDEADTRKKKGLAPGAFPKLCREDSLRCVCCYCCVCVCVHLF